MRHPRRPSQANAHARIARAVLAAALLAASIGTLQAQPRGNAVAPSQRNASAQSRCIFHHGHYQQLMRNGDDRGCGATAWRSRRRYSYDDVAVIAPRRPRSDFDRINSSDA